MKIIKVLANTQVQIAIVCIGLLFQVSVQKLCEY
jgi:hypothetical protein